MIVLKANQQQYNSLHGYRNGSSELLFVEDGNGNYIVGLNVLDDPAFAEIHDQLNELERIDYVPKQIEI